MVAKRLKMKTTEQIKEMLSNREKEYEKTHKQYESVGTIRVGNITGVQFDADNRPEKWALFVELGERLRKLQTEINLLKEILQ